MDDKEELICHLQNFVSHYKFLSPEFTDWSKIRVSLANF
jgi:hypothetical protein